MIRINEIKMPLGCTDEEVKQATAKALKIKESDIKSFSLARRSIDSRKKDNIILVYSAEIETDLDEESVVAPFPQSKAFVTKKYESVFNTTKRFCCRQRKKINRTDVYV